jgi:hypothetical protein
MQTLEPWPPTMPTVGADNLPDARARLRDLEAERDRLAAAELRSRLGLRPDHEARLRWLRDTVQTMRTQVAVVERLQSNGAAA